MAVQILNDELEHEHDIEDFLADINRLREDIKKFRM
jgi:bacterioferritin